MGLLAIPTDDLPAMIDENEAQIEAAGVAPWSYVSPGGSHTVLSSPSSYTETLNGTMLVEWVADKHYTVCTS